MVNTNSISSFLARNGPQMLPKCATTCGTADVVDTNFETMLRKFCENCDVINGLVCLRNEEKLAVEMLLDKMKNGANPLKVAKAVKVLQKSSSLSQYLFSSHDYCVSLLSFLLRHENTFCVWGDNVYDTRRWGKAPNRNDYVEATFIEKRLHEEIRLNRLLEPSSLPNKISKKDVGIMKTYPIFFKVNGSDIYVHKNNFIDFIGSDEPADISDRFHDTSTNLASAYFQNELKQCGGCIEYQKLASSLNKATVQILSVIHPKNKETVKTFIVDHCQSAIVPGGSSAHAQRNDEWERLCEDWFQEQLSQRTTFRRATAKQVNEMISTSHAPLTSNRFVLDKQQPPTSQPQSFAEPRKSNKGRKKNSAEKVTDEPMHDGQKKAQTKISRMPKNTMREQTAKESKRSGSLDTRSTSDDDWVTVKPKSAPRKLVNDRVFSPEPSTSTTKKTRSSKPKKISPSYALQPKVRSKTQPPVMNNRKVGKSPTATSRPTQQTNDGKQIKQRLQENKKLPSSPASTKASRPSSKNSSSPSTPAPTRSITPLPAKISTKRVKAEVPKPVALRPVFNSKPQLLANGAASHQPTLPASSYDQANQHPETHQTHTLRIADAHNTNVEFFPSAHHKPDIVRGLNTTKQPEPWNLNLSPTSEKTATEGPLSYKHHSGVNFQRHVGSVAAVPQQVFSSFGFVNPQLRNKQLLPGAEAEKAQLAFQNAPSIQRSNSSQGKPIGGYDFQGSNQLEQHSRKQQAINGRDKVEHTDMACKTLTTEKEKQRPTTKGREQAVGTKQTNSFRHESRQQASMRVDSTVSPVKSLEDVTSPISVTVRTESIHKHVLQTNPANVEARVPKTNNSQTLEAVDFATKTIADKIVPVDRKGMFYYQPQIVPQDYRQQSGFSQQVKEKEAKSLTSPAASGSHVPQQGHDALSVDLGKEPKASSNVPYEYEGTTYFPQPNYQTEPQPRVFHAPVQAAKQNRGLLSGTLQLMNFNLSPVTATSGNASPKQDLEQLSVGDSGAQNANNLNVEASSVIESSAQPLTDVASISSYLPTDHEKVLLSIFEVCLARQQAININLLYVRVLQNNSMKICSVCELESVITASSLFSKSDCMVLPVTPSTTTKSHQDVMS